MLTRLLLALAIVWLGHCSASAQQRVALVIGNGNYESAATLRNPVNDARAVATILRAVGFEVVESLDEPRGRFAATLRKFLLLAENSEVAFVHYGGHGVQTGGKNYLIPVDAELRTVVDVQLQGIDADFVLNSLGRPRLRILILDACRNNPFGERIARSTSASRSTTIGVGLANMSAQNNTFIAFATAPGSVALDGEGQPHSPLTAALIEHLTTPGLTIDEAFTRIRGEVTRRTNRQQIPWTNSNFTEPFYMAPIATSNKSDGRSPPDAAAAHESLGLVEYEMWSAAQKSGHVMWYEAYLRRYPNGVFAEIARVKIAAIGTRTEPPIGSPPASTDEGRPISALHVPPTDDAIRAADVSPTTEVSLALNATDWVRVQIKLSNLGLGSIAADGHAGEKTRAAIGAWQSRRSFPGNGYLNKLQLDALLREAGAVEANQYDPRVPSRRNSTASRPVAGGGASGGNPAGMGIGAGSGF